MNKKAPISWNPVTYFSEVQTELKKVTWPSRQQTQTLTLIVIGVSIAVGLYVGLLDLIFTKITEFLIK